MDIGYDPKGYSNVIAIPKKRWHRRQITWETMHTVGCVAWRLTDNQARHARPFHGSQAQMLMLLEMLLKLLLLLLYVFIT